MDTKIFLNIIILFNPNYKNIKYNGSTFKNLSLMDQFICFYNSIKINLKYDHQISIIHMDDFNKFDLEILNNLDVDLLKYENIDDNLSLLSIKRYEIKTKIKGTHRLIAETDMLLLKNPNFNWNADVQFGYGNLFNIEQVNRIIKEQNLKELKNYNYNILNENLSCLYNNDIINYKLLPPSINNGLVLIKEDFSISFYNNYLEKIIKNLLKEKNVTKHFIFQWMMGPIFLTATDNWFPFEKGINYLLKVNEKYIKKFKKENISLVHYCGTGGYEVALKYFPEFFNKNILK